MATVEPSVCEHSPHLLIGSHTHFLYRFPFPVGRILWCSWLLKVVTFCTRCSSDYSIFREGCENISRRRQVAVVRMAARAGLEHPRCCLATGVRAMRTAVLSLPALVLCNRSASWTVWSLADNQCVCLLVLFSPQRIVNGNLVL